MSDTLASITAGSAMQRTPVNLGAANPLGQRGNIWQSSHDDLQAMSRKFDGEVIHSNSSESTDKALVAEATTAFHRNHSSEKLAPSASAESIHAAAEIAAIMQCTPAVDPTLENQSVSAAAEQHQLPISQQPITNGLEYQQQYGSSQQHGAQRFPEHTKLSAAMSAYQASSQDNLLAFQQQHSSSAASLHDYSSAGARNQRGLQTASNIVGQYGLQQQQQQQQQRYEVAGQHPGTSLDWQEANRNGKHADVGGQVGSAGQPFLAHAAFSSLRPDNTAALISDNFEIPWDRLDRKLVHSWVHDTQLVPLDEHSASAPDSLYAELRPATQVSRHLWLGNLSPNLDRGTLLNVGQAFGPLTELCTFEDAEYAFMSFQSVQPACRACELLDGQQVPVLTGQRPMIVKFRPDAMHLRMLRPPSAASTSNGQAGGDVIMSPSPRLWLGNISNQVTAATVREAFEGFGAVVDAAAFPARIGPLGYAIVIFDKVEDAVRAVAAKNNRPDSLLSGTRPLKMRYKPDKELGRKGSPLSSGNLSPGYSGSIGSPKSLLQDKASRQLTLGNLLQDVAPSAIQLAFGQYGQLEAVPVLECNPLAGSSEARIIFREAASAAAALRALRGAFIPSLTGSRPLVVRFTSDTAPGSSSVAPLGQTQAPYHQQVKAPPLHHQPQQQQMIPGPGRPLPHQQPKPSGHGMMHGTDLPPQQQQQQAGRSGRPDRLSSGTPGRPRPLMGLATSNWAGGIPRPDVPLSTDSDEDSTMPAVNLSNRLNPNNIHYDRLLAAQYKRMSKPEKEALWAQDRLNQQQQQQQTQGQGRDTVTPLRSSLAGLRLGESRGVGAFNLPSRAFSHADLQALSGGLSDINSFASHTDLAALAAGLSPQAVASSMAQNQPPGLQRALFDSQFASHPNLSSAHLQQQVSHAALQRQQDQISQQQAQVQQMQQLAALQEQPHSLSHMQQNNGSSAGGPFRMTAHGSRGFLQGGPMQVGQSGSGIPSMNRSASSPHMDARLLSGPHQSPVGSRLAAAQHTSHGSLVSFTAPQGHPHGPLAIGSSNGPAASAAGPSPLSRSMTMSRGASHPNLPSAAAAGAVAGRGSRYTPSLQQLGSGGTLNVSNDPMQELNTRSEAYDGFGVGGNNYNQIGTGLRPSASFNSLHLLQQQQQQQQQKGEEQPRHLQQQQHSFGDGGIGPSRLGITPQQQQRAAGPQQTENMEATVAEAVHNAFQDMARQQAAQDTRHLHTGSRDQQQQQQSSVAHQMPSLQGISSSAGMPAHLLDPITQGLMLDPVIAADGMTYDRSAISQWLLTSSTSPVTGVPLQHATLTPNTAVRNYVTAYLTAAATSGHKLL